MSSTPSTPARTEAQRTRSDASLVTAGSTVLGTGIGLVVGQPGIGFVIGAGVGLLGRLLLGDRRRDHS